MLAGTRPLRILIIDNETRMRSTLCAALEACGYTVSTAGTGSESLKLLAEQAPDLVMIDLLLPDVSGLELVEHMEGRLPDCRFLLITGKASVDSATQAVRSSVVGYLVKPLDVGQVLAAAARVDERRLLAESQRRLQTSLTRAKERWEKIFDAIPDPIAIARPDGTLIQVNRAFATRFDDEAGSSPATDLQLIFGSDSHPLGKTARETAVSGGAFLDETDELVIDGTFSYACYPLELDDGPGLIHLLRDVSEQRRAESESRRLEAQIEKIHRVESIGRLAGGVAHDFNNLLTVILGNLELAEGDSAEGSVLHHSLVEARKAASRAAQLTQQLVTFARRQRSGDAALAPSGLDLNVLIFDTSDLLRRTLGEDIELHLHTANDLWLVKAEAAHMTQVLLNLAANARDAMPDGGALIVETRNRLLSPGDRTILPPLRPGEYVELVVRDTGEGIEEAVRPHLFEPFFTTKKVGAGSGLGLATTYGIVTRAGGTILADSPPAGGAAFTILLPRAETPAALKAEETALRPDVSGDETILLVEDDVAIRETIVPGLVALGYRVIAVPSAGEALRLLQQESDAIDLLITDIVMPDMNGFELAESIKDSQGRPAVLLVSGYPYDALEGRRSFDASTRWLSKPFTTVELAAKVREILDR